MSLFKDFSTYSYQQWAFDVFQRRPNASLYLFIDWDSIANTSFTLSQVAIKLYLHNLSWDLLRIPLA